MTLQITSNTHILSKAQDLFPWIRDIRRHLHQYPELSGQEKHTAAFLADQLEYLGWRVRRNVGGHGVVADLLIDGKKPTVALRVDMDALPIEEINKTDYHSKIPGVMHACGHDVHSAIGLGVAAILTEAVEILPGNVRLIFQPEEEEITGALQMIRQGALSNPAPGAIFGLHVAPLPAGKIGWTKDLFLAGFEHYLVILNTLPEQIDPYHLDEVARRCCRVIEGFNQWQLPETWHSMQAFWEKMQQGPQALQNFIYYSASMNEDDPEHWHGQFGIGIKAANRHLRRAAIGRIKAALNTICRATHTHYAITPMGSMLDMRNHTHLVTRAIPALEKTLGKNNLVELKAAFPFNCEDFAYFAKQIPGAMYWLGGANPAEGKYAMLHTPNFDVDETCLVTGAAGMTALLWDYLQYKHQENDLITNQD